MHLVINKQPHKHRKSPLILEAKISLLGCFMKQQLRENNRNIKQMFKDRLQLFNDPTKRNVVEWLLIICVLLNKVNEEKNLKTLHCFSSFWTPWPLTYDPAVEVVRQHPLTNGHQQPESFFFFSIEQQHRRQDVHRLDRSRWESVKIQETHKDQQPRNV